MCLGIPGKIIDIYEANDLHMGKVDFGGVTREVCLAYVPEAQIGNYTIVHVGFALNVLDEAEALETLQLLREIGALDEELDAEAAAVQVPSSSGGSATAALN
jgi:hydrogenase expression/formation protein HypC